MATKPNYLPNWNNVTPVAPLTKKKNETPVLPAVPVKLGSPVLPSVPVKLATPVTPPVVKKNQTPLTPVGNKVVATIVEQAGSTPKDYNVNWRDVGYSGYGALKDKKGKSYDYEVSLVPPKAGPYSVPNNEVRLYDENRKTIASLRWDNTTGEILMVEVDPAAQRRGIATELLRLANTVPQKYEHVQQPQHSRDRTTAGDAWASRVGGVVPPLIGTLPGEDAFLEARMRRIADSNLRRRGVEDPSVAQINTELIQMNARLGR